jgi:hypothetical protein
MSGNVAPARSDSSEAAAGLPTGYRVCVVPGGLDISARLATAEELRNLVKVLQAGIVILEQIAEGDMDEPLTLTKKVARISPAPSQ